MKTYLRQIWTLKPIHVDDGLVKFQLGIEHLNLTFVAPGIRSAINFCDEKTLYASYFLAGIFRMVARPDAGLELESCFYYI